MAEFRDESDAPGAGPKPPPLWSYRLRWGGHAAVLAAYPLAIALIGSGEESESSEPRIPADPIALVETVLLQTGLFVLVFGLAWVWSRATPAALMLSWRQGWAPLWRGFLYALGLRALLAVLILAAAAVAALWGGFDEEALRHFQPRTEALVDRQALLSSPAYLILNLSLVSFVFAGFREELWRAGLLAGLAALFPRLSRAWWGQAAAVAVTAIIFGLGHAAQGWGGVAVTTVLGLGLGGIMLWHRSIWDAVWAHGFFNATTFLALYAVWKFRPDLLPG